MLTGSPLVSMSAFLLVFLAICTAAYFAFFRRYGDAARASARLRELSADNEPALPTPGWSDWSRSLLPRLGASVSPGREDRVEQLKAQLTRAGLYQSGAVQMFWGVKLASVVVLSIVFGVVPFVFGLLTLPWALCASTLGSTLGLLGPSVWLNWCVGRQQSELRHGLPDFLDMLVLCLEGGMSLTAALPKVVSEMLQVHPALGRELTITQQTVNMGLSTGDALKQCGERCGLKEINDLAVVVLQSERFGASLVKTLRMHADAYRQERHQWAEEMAQKASVKVLFPMLLFIFPAIFIVLLGPAALQMAQLFAK
jgi:tight adherence protein C